MTRTGLPIKTSPRTAKTVEMNELLQILMNFTKLAITHSILAQKICSWAHFEGHGYGNYYPLVPLPVTCTGMSNLCISLPLIQKQTDKQ